MPVISVPTVQADTPVSAPGNPHGKDAVTFRGQPYMIFGAASQEGGVRRGVLLRLSGEINGQVYIDRIEYLSSSGGSVQLANYIGGTRTGQSPVAQPLNGGQSSGPAWGFQGVVGGDVSTQAYFLFPTQANERYVWEPPYPYLASAEGDFGVTMGGQNQAIQANIYLRIVT